MIENIKTYRPVTIIEFKDRKPEIIEKAEKPEEAKETKNDNQGKWQA